MNYIHFKYFLILISLIALPGCGNKFSVVSTIANPPPVTSSESSFCSTSTSYSPGVVVSGTAKFLRRGSVLSTSSGVVVSALTGSVNTTKLPIKYAEVRISLNGSVVQCGTTNSMGELKALDGSSSLFLPNGAGSYTVEVSARSNFTFPSVGKPVSATLNTAVKTDIYSNDVYKISGTLTSSGFGGSANSPINLVAQASEASSSAIEGGAFNIYNDWVTTFEYLTNTSNTGSLDVSCLNTRLDMFWKAGFNPATYLDSNAGSNTLSFYLRDDNELYICGGVSGNVATADTDHWDDAVIIHEMGHHIENVCGRMDSPGGTHYAQYRIDPRLAWSEGWGNFMGAHIVKNNLTNINPDLIASLPNNEWLFYSDTKGYSDTGGTGSQLILMRMNKPGSGTGAGSTHDAVTPASFPGESHTREASIARGLFKGVNTCASNCGGGLSFDTYWTALGRTSNGIGYTLSPFSSSAKFFAKVYAANGNSFPGAMTTIMTNDEALHMAGSASFTVTAASSSTGSISANAWPGYGIKLTTNTSCNKNVLQPRNYTFSTNSPSTYGGDSDQRYNNHFFAFSKSDLSGVTQIKLVPDSSCPVDLDLLVFTSDYDYNEDCTYYNGSGACTSAVKTYNNYTPVYDRNSTSTESVTISGLGSSYYLLNVRGYSATPSTIPNSSSCVYKLTDQNGATLCPSTSY